MSDFHGRVMNIECNMSASICRPAEDTALAYKYGHRDARHAAAEIANEADRAIRDSGATIAAKDSEIARLRDEIDGLRNEVAQLCGYDNAQEMDSDANRAALAGGGA